MKTLASLFVVLLGTIRVFAQESYTSPQSPSTFEYHGCALVDLSRFSSPIVFSDGRVTHNKCQGGCQGQKVAALFPELVPRAASIAQFTDSWAARVAAETIRAPILPSTPAFAINRAGEILPKACMETFFQPRTPASPSSMLPSM